MQVEVRYSVRFRIVSPVQFMTTVGDLNQAARRIEDSINPLIQEQFSSRTPRDVFNEFKMINYELKELVQKQVWSSSTVGLGPPWGIEILEFDLHPPDFGQTINSALTSISQAVADAERTRLTGSQIAAMRELFLRAESVGLREIANTLGIKDQSHLVALLQSQTTRDALSSAGNINIYGGGIANLLGLIDSITKQKS